MEKIKNKFVVLIYVLLMVGILFYIDVTVVKKVEKKLEDAENTIECLNEQILDLKRENSKCRKINDSLISRNPYIVGEVSWYGEKFHGNLMANGKPFNKNLLTAAHKTLPFGTVVLVTNVENGKSVKVIITDRGPYIEGRVIDLSEAAFSEISDLDKGVIKEEKAKIEII